MRFELPIFPKHQEGLMLLGEHEMHRRGLRVGLSEVRLLQRECRQMRALLYYPMVGTPNSARQPP